MIKAEPRHPVRGPIKGGALIPRGHFGVRGFTRGRRLEGRGFHSSARTVVRRRRCRKQQSPQLVSSHGLGGFGRARGRLLAMPRDAEPVLACDAGELLEDPGLEHPLRIQLR